MALALQWAERGRYTTTPNPRVGCVLVREGQQVGAGTHRRAGGPHAEVHALLEAGALAQGATAYVTLEPCSHFGRTPPCADALIQAGVRRVVVAMQDPNPLVAGRGLARLRAAGIQVDVGVLEKQAQALNPGFCRRMAGGRPWVRLKVAMSLDGKVALENGVSQWITGPAARADVQSWRARSCAIVTGVGTLLADDPLLTVRDHDIGRQPLRVILDGHFKSPPQSRIFQTGPVVVVGAGSHPGREAALRAVGAEIWHCPEPGAESKAQGSGRVDLPALLDRMAQAQLNEIWIEAGGRLNASFLASGLVDEYLIYLAPHILGGAARSAFHEHSIVHMSERTACQLQDQRLIGHDLRLIYVPSSVG